MGLFGSLFTGVSALFAQSQNTAIISNNIANISTTGFKRSEASFQSLVTTASRLSTYSPGTVSVNRIQRVDQQGGIQQTSSGTDAAISGNGFFPVRRSTAFGQDQLYTRAGQFSEDSQGLLRNAAGFVLYAWPIDANGDLPANQGDLTSLVPADVAFLGGLTRPTTDANLAINLNADQARTTWEVGTDGTVRAVGQEQFSRGLTVFDSLGSAQTLNFEFYHVQSPTPLGVSNSTTVLSNTDDVGVVFGAATVAEGDSFTIDVNPGGAGVTSFTFEYDTDAAVAGANVGFQTVGELIAAINNSFAGEVEARLTPGGDLIVESVNADPATTLEFTDNVGDLIFGDLNFEGAGGAAIASGVPIPAPTFPVGNTTSAGTEGFVFPTIADINNPNTQGWWEVRIFEPDGTQISRGLLNFDGDGTLNAVPDENGDVDIQLNGINWGNGSSLQNISIDVERFSQFAGNFDVIFSDQNGAELGLRTGVELTRDGRIVARFSNGASTDLYQVPLITFANSNGLTEVSGTAYSETEESGEENLREAGTGGAGFVEPSTLEASNVDLADEFARLIVSQRAFGAGTRVITTVDQMTQDLLSLR